MTCNFPLGFYSCSSSLLLFWLITESCKKVSENSIMSSAMSSCTFISSYSASHHCSCYFCCSRSSPIFTTPSLKMRNGFWEAGTKGFPMVDRFLDCLIAWDCGLPLPAEWSPKSISSHWTKLKTHGANSFYWKFSDSLLLASENSLLFRVGVSYILPPTVFLP